MIHANYLILQIGKALGLGKIESSDKYLVFKKHENVAWVSFLSNIAECFVFFLIVRSRVVTRVKLSVSAHAVEYVLV